MAYFLFLDESGHDLIEAPYEVLAGICVEDKDVWNLIDALHTAEEHLFEVRYTRVVGEIKGKKFLKRKVFRQAAILPPITPDRRPELARLALEQGAHPTRERITALAQAKLEFVRRAFEIVAQFRCFAFASIVDRGAPRPASDMLRKDYAFLFERFFYFLEDRGPEHQGVVVFDELDKAQSNVLLRQMEHYFLNTQNGRVRSRQIIPAPFFVHSDLTTLIQVADLLAYVISWGFRVPGQMAREARPELGHLADLIANLRYQATREQSGNPNFRIWSFAVIDDLRGRDERSAEGEAQKQKRQ